MKYVFGLFLVIFILQAVGGMAVVQTLDAEQQSYEQDAEFERWFRECIPGIGKYLVSLDLPLDFEGDVYAEALEELNTELNLSAREINLIREVILLETERERLMGELMETLPEITPEQIEANTAKEQQIEQKRMELKQKAVELQVSLGNKTSLFENWMKKRKEEFLDKYKKKKEELFQKKTMQ
jgi:uncharacterized protein YceK